MRELVIESKCTVCGKEFSGKEAMSWCSTDCWRKENTGKIRRCFICGNEFDCGKNKRKMTCTKHCGSKLRWFLGKKACEPKIPKNCDFCGKVFMARTKKYRFCCAECREKWTSEHSAVVYEPRKCVWCGKTFQPLRYHDILCSEECREQRNSQIGMSKPVRILITDVVPVFAELQPHEGEIYDAEYMPPTVKSATEAYLIRNIHGTGKHVFVRGSECKLVEAAAE